MKFIISLALGLATLAAQTPVINGSFFFEERGTAAQSGRSFASVGVLKLDGQGRVSGQQFVKDLTAVGSRAITGTYQFDNEGIGTMTLQYTITDNEGETSLATAQYRLVYTAGRILMLRTDNGVLADGALVPDAGAATALKGTFVIDENAIDAARQATLSQSLWKFDGNGNVEARVVSKSFYQSAAQTLTGRLEAQGDGTYLVRLAGPQVTDEDGWTSAPATVSYRLIPGAQSFDLLRADDGVTSEIGVHAK